MPFNINKLPGDGYLILPLSMSRLSNSQSPDMCYEILQYFESKFATFGVDVIILYTNGLYYNVDETALNVRRSTNKKMFDHKNRLQNLILKNRQFMPQAIHFLPWDFVPLNADNFQTSIDILRATYAKDEMFRNCVLFDLDGREPNEANIDFVLEEIVATHVIRQKLIQFPKTLVRSDNFRLMVYPGPYIHSDYYQFAHDLLPKNRKLTEDDYPYAAGHYDFGQKVIYDFRDIDR